MNNKKSLAKTFNYPTLILAYFLIMCSSGLTISCSDVQTIEEAAADGTAPDGVLPNAGPKFCDDRRPPASVACLSGESCVEYLPEYMGDVDILREECINDGGQLVDHCAATDQSTLGACVEGDRLRISYTDAEIAQEDCAFDEYEWIECPSLD
jgi:hypothetical protein